MSWVDCFNPNSNTAKQTARKCSKAKLCVKTKLLWDISCQASLRELSGSLWNTSVAFGDRYCRSQRVTALTPKDTLCVSQRRQRLWQNGSIWHDGNESGLHVFRPQPPVCLCLQAIVAHPNNSEAEEPTFFLPLHHLQNPAWQPPQHHSSCLKEPCVITNSHLTPFSSVHTCCLGKKTIL